MGAVPVTRGSGAGAPAVGRGSRAALAIATGLALVAAFPSLEIAPLAWVGLVPLLVAIRGLRPRAAFAVGWLAGLVFWTGSVYWIVYTVSRYTTVPLPAAVGLLLLVASVLGCYLGAFAAGMRWFATRGLPAVWLAAPLWVALEWLRGWFFIGFPWGPLGASQYRHHDLVQMAEVTGVWGVSAVLVLFNAVAAAVLQRRGEGVRRLMPALLVLTVLMLGLPLAGHWRASMLRRQPAAGSLRVTVVQGNVEQEHKWDPAFQDETLERYQRLTRESLAAKPDLIVWPETAAPFFFQEPGPRREAVLDLARTIGVPLLFGSPAAAHDARGEFKQTNRAYLLSPQGREVGVYDKMQLVPFGEYVPFARALFFVGRVVEAVGDILPGLVPTVFRLNDARFGTLICYEGIFPAATREFAARGADFLVNISNDAWYGRSAAPYQLLAQVSLRAVENRVPIVRAANTGISAIIDADGRIRWQGPLFEALAYTAEITWPGVRTVYGRWGDWFPRACLLAVGIALVVGMARRR
ncbi:MAG: apolipoprotein N-acyltransferase [Candidatus Binatia bacterium]